MCRQLAEMKTYIKPLEVMITQLDRLLANPTTVASKRQNMTQIRKKLTTMVRSEQAATLTSTHCADSSLSDSRNNSTRSFMPHPSRIHSHASSRSCERQSDKSKAGWCKCSRTSSNRRQAPIPLHPWPLRCLVLPPLRALLGSRQAWLQAVRRGLLAQLQSAYNLVECRHQQRHLSERCLSHHDRLI